MFKSLYSGVSGLGANLTNLDVIGNNIANSNTVGFKSGRVTFNEMLTQTIKSASRPVAGGLGGTNPQQVGLGTQVGSIDTNFNQGNFQTTGKKTDLAIQGSGFFILNDGASNVYTRAGIFGIDSENTLVNPSTGLRVQGVMADADGVLPTGPMTDIVIDPTLVVPAQPSSSVSLMGNLDSSSDAKPTIMQSPSFLAAAEGTDLLTSMSGQMDGVMNLRAGDVIKINGHEAGVSTDLSTATFTVASDSTYDDLVNFLNSTMSTEGRAITFNIGGSGELTMTNNDADIEAFSLSVEAKTLFNTNFTFPSNVANGTSESSSELRAFAESTDLLADLYDSTGDPLDIDFSVGTPTLLINGDVGGEAVTERSVAVTGTSTLGDLMQEFQFALGINSNPVTLNETGQIMVTGEVGTAGSIGKISLSEQGIENTTLSNAFAYNEIQEASDLKTYSMSTTVYDSLGGEHTISFEFEKVPGQNEWIWTASMDGGEEILSGGSGRIR
nr:flagellar hook-basal body complex protein [Candidatus Krumholzibacteria bacterium]